MAALKIFSVRIMGRFSLDKKHPGVSPTQESAETMCVICVTHADICVHRLSVENYSGSDF